MGRTIILKRSIPAYLKIIVNLRPLKRKTRYQNLQAKRVSKLLVWVNHDNLVKEELVTKDISKVSGIKTTHRIKMILKIEK